MQKEVKQALELAEPNRAELEKVLDHYSKDATDKIKLKATQFLISNMPIHGNQLNKLTDRNGNELKFYPLNYSSWDATKNARDSISSVNIIKSKYIMDCREVKSDYLIKSIETAFKAWQQGRWTQQVSFNTFCEYILPYRASNEPLSDWQDLLVKKYKPILDSLPVDVKIIEACKAVNTQLANDIKYNHRWILGFGSQSVVDLSQSGSGMCDDLTAYGVSVMRVLGIPSTTDYTIWGKASRGHSWCVVFDENGKAWSFGPGEQQPGDHIKIFSEKGREYRQLAKVFRITYSIQPDALASIVPENYEIPKFFLQRNYLDVTPEYVNTHDISMEIGQVPDDQLFAYICVFNLGIWRPIHWGKIKNSRVVFTKMGLNVMYLVGYYANGIIHPITDPFFIDFDKNRQNATPTKKHIKELALTEYKSQEGHLKIISGVEYELSYWDTRGWQSYEKQTAENGKVVFHNVPSGHLYLFKGGSYRPFSVQNDSISWW